MAKLISYDLTGNDSDGYKLCTLMRVEGPEASLGLLVQIQRLLADSEVMGTPGTTGVPELSASAVTNVSARPNLVEEAPPSKRTRTPRAAAPETPREPPMPAVKPAPSEPTAEERAADGETAPAPVVEERVVPPRVSAHPSVPGHVLVTAEPAKAKPAPTAALAPEERLVNVEAEAVPAVMRGAKTFRVVMQHFLDQKVTDPAAIELACRSYAPHVPVIAKLLQPNPDPEATLPKRIALSLKVMGAKA